MISITAPRHASYVYMPDPYPSDCTPRFKKMRALRHKIHGVDPSAPIPGYI